ncbi:MAG TPA: hypothetical protein DF613_16735 [Lachnospiraceae bacterium]|nr:hypothetical protein [Lachnospiraceae bacterium]
MNNEFESGLDQELGFTREQEKVIPIQEEKPRRKPFHIWEAGDKEYRMKLTTGMICKLEEKFRTNLLNVISADGVPPLGHMLTIAQGAMAPWYHNLSYADVQRIFDTYVDEGGNQLSFYSDVIMGVMAVSGFFTEAQAKEIAEKVKQDDTML